MRVALIGATGNVGSRILQELARRKIHTTALAREVGLIASDPYVDPITVDAHDASSLVEKIRGHDAVISAVPFETTDAKSLIDAVRKSGVPRYLVVGGAGSLLTPGGGRLVDSPDFPEIYKAESLAGAKFLETLSATQDLDWTFLSPSAELFPGERTGQFRLGDDQLLLTAEGSKISLEDYAVAMVDELEQSKHGRRRFTVGY